MKSSTLVSKCHNLANKTCDFLTNLCFVHVLSKMLLSFHVLALEVLVPFIFSAWIFEVSVAMVISYSLYLEDDVIQNGRPDLAKPRSTARVKQSAF